MKIVLVNGPCHGEVWELASTPRAIVRSDERYLFYTRPFFSPRIALYNWECSLPEDESNLRELVCRLVKKDQFVALNEWCDEQLACRLSYDRHFKQGLFPARVSFELAITEIENRRTAARLKRRFPGVC